jgi:hypothetical protein
LHPLHLPRGKQILPGDLILSAIGLKFGARALEGVKRSHTVQEDMAAIDIDYTRRNKKPRLLTDAERDQLDEFIDSIHYSSRYVHMWLVVVLLWHD